MRIPFRGLASILLGLPLMALCQAPCLAQQAGQAAEGGVRLGPLRVHPGIAVTETFTDNYFLDKDDKRSEWITTVSPSLVLHLPIRRHSVDFQYRSDFNENARLHDYNTDNHMLAGRFTLDFPGGLLIKAGHQWIYNNNPATTFGEENKRFMDNLSTVEAVYRFSDRYSVGARYGHTVHRFDEERFDLDDSDKDDVALEVGYRILPKTTLFLEGGWTGTQYPNRDPVSFDNDLYRVWIGARTKPTAKIVGELKGGWSRKVFQDDRVGDDVSTYGFEGSLHYDPTPYTRLGLVLFRRIEDTQFTTTQSVAYGATYNTTGGTFQATQRFTPRLSARGSVGLVYDQYNEEGITGEKRKDTRFQGGLGIDYKIWKWIVLGSSYRFTRNDSNVDMEDYTENRFMAHVSFGF
jgi:hypothetical protein